MRLFQLTLNNTKCVFETVEDVLAELHLLLKECDDEYTIKAIELTEEAYDNLGDFAGW